MGKDRLEREIGEHLYRISIEKITAKNYEG